VKRKRPPGPTWFTEARRPWDAIVSDHTRGLLPIVRSRFERFGDLVYATDITGKPLISMRHPDHVHEVLVTRAADFTKRSKDLEVFLGRGLLTSDGEFWRSQRRKIQPAFRHEKLAKYAEIMVDRARRMVDGWVEGELYDLNREMMEVTLSVVAKALLDYDTTDDNDHVARAMTIIQETAGYPSILPRWVSTPLHKKQQEGLDAIDGIVFPLIDEREVPGEDLLSQLKFPEEGESMERQQLRDELVTMFLAGHETTALALTWTFFLLSNHRDQEAKLHAELDEVLGDRAPSFADLESLVFTKNAVQEAMRLFPPLYLLPRVAVRETEVGGYPLAAGDNLLIWIYFMHRDERWFPDHAEFLPDRFLPESGGVKHPHAFIPFGAGPRACIGRHFGMAEATLMLAVIAQRFKPRLAPGQEVRLHARVTLAPQFPIEMELEPRHP
jgi:cytochrome P450